MLDLFFITFVTIIIIAILTIYIYQFQKYIKLKVYFQFFLKKTYFFFDLLNKYIMNLAKNLNY